MQNDFVVDFGIHVVVDAFADGVWKLNWGWRVSSDFGGVFFGGKDDWTYVWVGVLVL